MAVCALIAASAFFNVNAQHFVFSTYGQTSGLKNLNVSSMLQDRRGAIWMGTESGIFLADGTRFVKQRAFDEVHFELTRAMHEDSAARIWAMDSRHLVYWENDKVRVIEQLKLKLLPSEGVDIISMPQYPDAVLILRDGELLRIATGDKGRTWQITTALPASLLAQHTELHALKSVLVAGRTLWAGCAEALCRIDLDRGSSQVFKYGEGVEADSFKRLLITRSGMLWARGKKTLVTLAPGASHFTKAELPAHFDLDVQEASLIEDPDGNVVMNLSKGVASTNGTAWHLYTPGNGLPVDEIETLMFDHSGELWLAPLGHGITRWHGYGNWEGWTTSEGMSSDVIWSEVRDRSDQIWTVNHGGLDKLMLQSNRITPQKSSVPFIQVSAVLVDERQHIWTGDGEGQVIDYDPASGKARLAAVQLARVFKMHIDKRQQIWVCSRTGLSYFSRDDGWSKPRPGGSGLPAGYVWDITESRDGTLWVTTGLGLFRRNGDRWQQIQLPFSGGRGYNFMITAAPDGTLWCQSKSPTPLLHLQVTGDVAKVIGAAETSAITSDNITFVDTDKRGWIWVGSDAGVYVYNGIRWVQCTQDDGLLWDDTDFHAFFADPDGSVWIGTSAGLSHLKHPERLYAIATPTVQIEDIRLANIAVGSKAFANFDLRRPTLTARVFNTNYDRRDSIIFRSKLDGLESEWQETDGGNLRFPALNAGRYTLKVIAYDQRQHLTSAPNTFSFTVLEPWWRRSWFRALEGLILLVTLIAAWRFNVHLLLLRQRELESLVTARTLELEKEKSDLLTARSALLEISRRDSLTGLLNRAAIFDQMHALCSAASDTGIPLAVAMADLDSFKSINDTYGHVFGDAVLRECSARVGRTVRLTDWVGRYGGEELLILLPGLSPSDAAHRMEEIRLAISQEPITYGDFSVTVTCSFGVAWLDSEPSGAEALVGRADEALYLAKEGGRNRVEFALGKNATEARKVLEEAAIDTKSNNSPFYEHGMISMARHAEALDSGVALA